jgi:hypothetical protein
MKYLDLILSAKHCMSNVRTGVKISLFLNLLVIPRICRGGNAPTIWAIIHCFIMTTVRRLGFRTNPQGQRVLANQVHQVFDILFCSYSY